MAASPELLFLLLPLVFVMVASGHVSTFDAESVVTGTVFCDSCKDGSRSFFDFPVYGARVGMACGNHLMEQKTNLLGLYTIKYDGRLDQCAVQVIAGPPDCTAAVGSPQPLKPLFNMFGVHFYTVDPLLTQPNKPMSFCAQSPAPATGLPSPSLLPSPSSLPSPLLEASACSYEKWLLPEFRCRWRVVVPETLVSAVFGPVSAAKYGSDTTLWDALHGRGDVYQTLLREATAALLNSYDRFGFVFPTLSVLSDMNSTLLGSQKEVLMAALRFRRANSGVSGDLAAVTCKFTTCS